MSWLCTDTKGDLFRNYAGTAKDCYGYNISVLDLRNPTRSDGDNILTLVNKYMDEYLAHPENLAAKAKAEKYAKITAKTIICSDGAQAGSYGQNAFFYDAAEGLLASVILLIAEFCPPEKRHIVSVFKLIQDLLAPSPVKNRSLFQLLMDKLPPDHKARWFAGAALNSADQAMASVLSTAMSRLNAFLDSEMEQILCFDSKLDTETFCKEKSAIFIVLPEEDNTKYFMVSLFLQQIYREMLTIANEYGGKLPNRVMLFADEIGTIPKIESMEMMFSAGRSRRISMVPIIQSFAQLEKNYGKEGSSIIIDNCQDILFGGFAPNSESAEILSKALGNRTVLSGSISRGKNDPSQSLQMMSLRFRLSGHPAGCSTHRKKMGRYITPRTARRSEPINDRRWRHDLFQSHLCQRPAAPCKGSLYVPERPVQQGEPVLSIHRNHCGRAAALPQDSGAGHCGFGARGTAHKGAALAGKRRKEQPAFYAERMKNQKKSYTPPVGSSAPRVTYGICQHDVCREGITLRKYISRKEKLVSSR